MAKQVIHSITMKHTYKIIASLFIIALAFSCKDEKAAAAKKIEETLTSGTTTILVDNTVEPAVDDVLQVFHSVYPRAHVTLVNKSETEVVKDLVENKAGVAVMSRLLTDEENAYFVKRKITPQITQFASDAVAFITNKAAKDTVVELNEILKLVKGQTSDKVQKLVFDNANSSTVDVLLNIAGVKQLPSQNIYSLKTNEEVIRYVHDNPGSIGVVGVNWLSQPSAEMSKIVSDITVLAVDNVKIDKSVKRYYKPTQSNIATSSYPLIRKVYVLNYSGRDGLGMGFATYIGAFEGQRIILKTGLLPIKLPYREIEVTN